MATDKSENHDVDSTQAKKPGESGGMSMKDRLLAERKAAAEGASKAPPVPAAKPASARPAATPAAAATPRAAPTAAPRSAPKSEPAPEVKRPVKLASQKAEEREERASPRRGAKKEVSAEVQREVAMLRKAEDKWIMYGWIAAGALLVVAGVVYFTVIGKRNAIEKARADYVKSVNDFQDKVKTFDITKKADGEAALKYIEENKDLWMKTDIDGVKSLATRTQSSILANQERAKEIGELRDGLAGVKTAVADAANKKPEELAQLRRKVTDYEQKGDSVGPDFVAEVATLKTSLDRVYATRLHEEAKAAGSKGPSEARAALTLYAKNEDEITKLLDAASSRRKKEEQEFFAGHFKEMIAESDALAAVAFTPDVIEKTPWLDLLGGEQAKNWQSPGTKGFQVKDGVLHAVAEDPGANKTAVLSIGDREKWRDYAFECDFIVVKGTANFHFRLGNRVDRTTTQVVASTTGQDPLKAGQSYSFAGSFIGSKLKVNYTDGDRHQEEDVDWLVVRKGAIGMSLPEGSELKITKLRIRPLR